jgi:hypothetical protein
MYNLTPTLIQAYSYPKKSEVRNFENYCVQLRAWSKISHLWVFVPGYVDTNGIPL